MKYYIITLLNGKVINIDRYCEEEYDEYQESLKKARENIKVKSEFEGYSIQALTIY